MNKDVATNNSVMRGDIFCDGTTFRLDKVLRYEFTQGLESVHQMFCDAFQEACL